MRKLFLTSFIFKKAEIEHKEYRLVLVNGADLKTSDPQEEYEVAYIKARAWFKTEFPETELIGVIAHSAIDGVADSRQSLQEVIIKAVGSL